MMLLVWVLQSPCDTCTRMKSFSVSVIMLLLVFTLLLVL